MHVPVLAYGERTVEDVAVGEYLGPEWVVSGKIDSHLQNGR